MVDDNYEIREHRAMILHGSPWFLQGSLQHMEKTLLSKNNLGEILVS